MLVLLNCLLRRFADGMRQHVQALLQKLQAEQRLMKRRLERQHASSVRDDACSTAKLSDTKVVCTQSWCMQRDQG